MKKMIPYYGLIAVMCYFITTLGLILIGNTAFIVLMELSTILSAPVLLMIFIAMPTAPERNQTAAKTLSVIFMACCMVLTSAVHFLNIAFIMPLQNAGTEIPLYFQIGRWPSALMAVDYLGWGFFMGLAFLASSFAVAKEHKPLKITLSVCGILCLLGLVGTVGINENCWYIAPCGYGIGSAVICVQLILINKAGARKSAGE